MQDWTARQAVLCEDVTMLALHIEALEHRLAATEANLHHALLCGKARECSRCALLLRDLNRRVHWR